MNESESVRILEEMMQDVRRLALEKEVSVSDIVHEALGEFLYLRKTGINYFDIIYGIEESMNKIEHFVVSANPYDFAVSVKSPLQYVHRPALKYDIRITQNGGPYIGKMNMVLRSTDINTLKSFMDFLSLWVELETKYLPRQPSEQIEYTADVGHYSRKIFWPAAIDHVSGPTIGSTIGKYIHVFDSLFKHYFFHPHNSQSEIESMYITHVKDGSMNV